MWVPKGSAPIKIELITQRSTSRPTLKSEPQVASKILLCKHINEKADPWSYDRHGVPKESREVKSLQVEVMIIGDHIIDSQHSTHQYMGKGIHI
jgi:hypothetical protein